MIRRRQSSYQLSGSLSYGVSRDKSEDNNNYEGWSGTAVTVYGMVSIGSSRWIDDAHPPARSLSMAFKGRMYHRYEDAPIYSAKHAAYLAGRFARDVVRGRVR